MCTFQTQQPDKKHLPTCPSPKKSYTDKTTKDERTDHMQKLNILGH